MTRVHEGRKEHLQELKALGYPVVDYTDKDYGKGWYGIYHRCPAPWSTYAVTPLGSFLDLYTGERFEPHPGTHQQPYPTVSLVYDGTIKTRTVVAHRVVAATFLDNQTGLPYEMCQVDHIDSDKSNYSYLNLQIVTPARNKALAYLKGERSDNRHVVVTDLSTGRTIQCYSQAEAARVIGVDPALLCYYFRKHEDFSLHGYRVVRLPKEQVGQ